MCSNICFISRVVALSLLGHSKIASAVSACSVTVVHRFGIDARVEVDIPQEGAT